MTTETTDETVETTTTPAAELADREMGRRAFAATVGMTLATAAGAGTAAADGEQTIPNFSSEFTPAPRVINQTYAVDEHTPAMEQLEYVDNDGNVQSFSDEFGVVLALRDGENEPHNPVGFHPAYIETDEYTAFPRGVTREDADGEEEDVSALDAEEWVGDLLISDDGDALVLETDGLVDGAAQSATFDNFTIDSGEARKVLQLVLDVEQLEADATVSVDVVDAAGTTVSARIDPAGDAASEDVIATSQGSGIVFQTELGEFDGGADLDTLEEIVVEATDANATVKVHGMNLELDSEWSFGEREHLDEEDEVVTDTVVEPSGRTWITSLPTLTNQFTDATLFDLEYHVETRAEEAPIDNWSATTVDVDRGSYDQRYRMAGALELPGGLYEVEVVEPGEVVGEVRHPDDAYRTAEFAHDLSSIPDLEDVEDVSWTDATSVFESGDIGDEVDVSPNVSAGDRIGFHFEVEEEDDIIDAMVTTAGAAAGGAPMSSGGGIMSSLWGWAAAGVTGVVAVLAYVRHTATSTVTGQ